MTDRNADGNEPWTPADDIDRVLEYVWESAAEAETVQDGATYARMQRARLRNAREKLDALIRGGGMDPGWTFYECDRCFRVIYEGGWISPEDFAALLRVHKLTCEGTP